MENSKAEWCHHTFNPWRWDGYEVAIVVVASDAQWRQPLKWNREAKEAGQRRRVFCASLADVFEDQPDLAEPRRRLGKLIIDTPDLDWLLLTKRPENARQATADMWIRFFHEGNPLPPNVWVGTSVEDQQRADERIPHLLQIPARVRFLSCEPLLGPVDLRGIVRDFDGERMRFDALDGRWHPDGDGFDPGWAEERINWVIVGGESGGGERPMLLEWARSLRDQCQSTGVPFFMKQLAHPRSPDLMIRQFPNP